MKAGRNNEQPQIWFRADRVFMRSGGWFFRTREGVELGPYETERDATLEARMLKEMLRESTELGALEVIREFVLASYTMGRPLTPQFTGDQLLQRQPAV